MIKNNKVEKISCMIKSKSSQQPQIYTELNGVFTTIIDKDTLISLTGLTGKAIGIALKNLKEGNEIVNYQKIKNSKTGVIDHYEIQVDNRMAIHHFCKLNEVHEEIIGL